MKKNIAKSILSWLLVFSMVLPSLSYVINTQAADGDIKDYDVMSMEQLLASDESLTWVITGDSITHNGGWTAGLNSYGEWMEQYLDEYGRGDDSVVLTGWGGASTEDFQTVENTPDGAGTKQPGQEGQGIENFITKYNPDVVTIKLGMNDRYKTKTEFVTYYKKMLDSLYDICKTEYNKVPKVIVLSPTPIASENFLDDEKHGEVADGVFESTTRQRNALEQIVKDYNNAGKHLLFCDLRTAFLKEAQALGENYVSTFFQDPSDGAIHPNGAGQYCIFKTLANTLGIYDPEKPIFQIEYEDLVYHSLYADKTDGVTYTGDYGYTSDLTVLDNAEMNKTMLTLDGVNALASVDFSSGIGNFVYNKTDVNASTVDLTEEADGVNTLTVEELRTVGKEFSIVFRAKLNPDASRTCQPIFYVSNTTETVGFESDTHNRVVLSVPGVNDHNQWYVMRKGSSDIANFMGASSYKGYGNLYKNINDGQWHTIALVQYTDKYMAYVDGIAYPVKKNNGEEIFLTSAMGAMFEDATELDAVIGRWGKADTNWKTQGKFDYWQFYGQALTADQIATLSLAVAETSSWSDTLVENHTWAVAGGTQMAGYDGVVVNRSLMRYIENSVRGGSYDYRDIHMFNLASSGSDVVTLAEKYSTLKEERNYNVFLLLPEIPEKVYKNGYEFEQADIDAYQTAINNLIEANSDKVIILWTPLASNNTTINGNIDKYAKAVRDIADANSKILFFDANRFMNDSMKKNTSLLDNWFEDGQYVSPLCTVDVARAFFETMTVNITGKGELIAHNLRYTSDEKIYKGKYVRDNIAAEASVSGTTVTVDVEAIRTAYPNATLSFKVLPHKTVENNNKNSVELSKVTTVDISDNGNVYSFEAPCKDLNLAIYGEENGLIYRFKDISLNVETDKTITTATPDGVYLSSLEVMSAPEFEFDIDTTTYNVNLYQYQSHVTIRATAQTGLTIKVAGDEVASGTESKAIEVEDGSTVTVEVTDGTTTKTYTLTMSRPVQPDIIITEVMSDGYSGYTKSGNDNYELVEIYNASGKDLNLLDYSIAYKKDYTYNTVNVGNGAEFPYYFTGNNLLVGKETHAGIKQLTKYSMYWKDQGYTEPDEITFKADSTMVIWIKYSPQENEAARTEYGKALTYETLIAALEKHKGTHTLSVDIGGTDTAVVPKESQIVVAEVKTDMKSGSINGAANVLAKDAQKNWYLENHGAYNAGGQQTRSWLFILKNTAKIAQNYKVTEDGNDIISAAKYVRSGNTDKLSNVLSYNYDRGMSLVKNEAYINNSLVGKANTSDVMGYSNKTSFGAIEYWQKPTDFEDKENPTITDKTEKETTVGANLAIQLELADETDVRYVEVYARKAGDTEFTKYAKDFVLEASVKNEGVATDVKNATFTCVVENVTDTVEYYATVVDGYNHVATLGSAEAPITVNTLPKVTIPYDVAEAKEIIGDHAPTCEYEGYLFSGWYADAKCENTPIVSAAVASQYETVYALFVPKEVLGVRAQLISHLEDTDATNDPTGTIRFVTSIDSKWYKEVGFNVSYDLDGDGIIEDGEKATRTSNKAYSKLLYIGGTDGQTMEYYPEQEFSSVSKYFKACTVKELSEVFYDLDFTVEPFWKTPDGIIVKGDPQVKRINDGIALKYEAKNDTKYYADLEVAVNEASNNSTVTVFRDAEVESAMAVNANVTIQNRVGRDITIYRGKGLATTNTFNVGTAGTLTIKGADDENSIVLDGRKKTDADANVGRDAATRSSGSLISNFGNLNIENVTVQYVTKSSGTGGVINSNNDNATNANAMVTVKNAKFDNNYSASYGSVLYSRAKSTFTNVTFTNNKSDNNGGVICNHAGSLFEVKSSTFKYNEGKEGGVIWSDRAFAVEGSTFMNNKGSVGGVILTSATFTVKDSTFDTNTSTGIGGAIHSNAAGAQGTIQNSKFLNNVSGNAGGAIHNKGTGTTVSGSTFTNNMAATAGGAICADASMSINSNTTFTENKANGGVAGAIYFTGSGAKGTIDNCTFSSNQASSAGGAIHNKGTGTTVSGSTFTSNTATTNGGAICTDVAITIQNTEFTSNEANKQSVKTQGGGAIYTGSNVEIKIENCDFISNKSVGAEDSYGGAIYMKNGTLNMTSTDGSNFESNTATHGGAIYMTTGTGNISACGFKKNQSVWQGGAICSNGGSLSVTNAMFESNVITRGQGGAIKLNASAKGTITNCNFSKNEAPNGGAIHEQGTLTISGGNFSDNKATNGKGGAINAQANTDTIKDNCTFTGNTATAGGQAIYYISGTLNLDKSIYDKFGTGDILAESNGVISQQ